eukprot:2532579-Prymnesium_polylepis.1
MLSGHGRPASGFPFGDYHRRVEMWRKELALAVARHLGRIHMIHRDVRQRGDALSYQRGVLWRQNDRGR